MLFLNVICSIILTITGIWLCYTGQDWLLAILCFAASFVGVIACVIED